MNVVVLSIDRLHVGFLGCYGNSWVATPHFNRLAAESFVFDQAIIDHPQLDNLFCSWWLGQHALERAAVEAERSLSVVRQLGEAGFATALITDEPQATDHQLARHFARRLQVSGPRAADTPADEVSQTRTAELLADAADWLTDARPPFFLWLHSQGLGAAWDAPDEFRQQYAEPDEPEPLHVAAVPCRRLLGDEDPDELWGICQAYAGQISLIDACLGGLLEFLDSESYGRDTLLMVLSARGFPLGRNGRLGAADDALYTELVQVPWFVRLPGGRSAACRSQALVQPCDLAPTLADLLSIDHRLPSVVGRSLLPVIHEDIAAVRDRACLVGSDGERAIRTAAWHLRLPAAENAGGAALAELFSKPDDRWDQNDVADRCPDVVDGLSAALHDLEASIGSGTTTSLPPLDEALISDLR